VSKNVAMFVDVANIYYAARGQDLDVDYVAMLKHATKGRDLIRAYAYSGLDPENENQRKFIDFLGKNGYKVLTKDIRKFGDGRVKANLDIELVVDLFRLADRMDIAVIVSGDGDFAPAIKALQDKGVRCEVISFKPNTSSDLIAVADEFIDIQKIAGIGRKKGEGSRAEAMSMPEMPAKEVVPEFGFREASPSVAAAALAAIKGGGATKGNGRSGTRRGRRAPDAATEPEAAAAVAETEEAKRRRRRRGGRGRGRGRRGEEAAAEPLAPAGEPEWEELDDLSKLEGLGEEREYSFSEADPDTLRELGLLEAADAAAGTEAAEAAGEPTEAAAGAAQPPQPPAEEPKPRRRRTTRTKAAAAEADAAAPAQPEEKPKRRRTTRRTAAAADEAAPAEEEAPAEPATRRRRTTRAKAEPAAEGEGAAAEEKPKRRRTTRRASAKTGADDAAQAAVPAAEDAEAGEARPEGIWGRFRSARGDRG
jgi:uncharacterized LabA/DUF88 family protein